MGSFVGLYVGSLVGVMVGTGDGSGVGVGATVGASVGAAVGGLVPWPGTNHTNRYNRPNKMRTRIATITCKRLSTQSAGGQGCAALVLAPPKHTQASTHFATRKYLVSLLWIQAPTPCQRHTNQGIDLLSRSVPPWVSGFGKPGPGIYLFVFPKRRA